MLPPHPLTRTAADVRYLRLDSAAGAQTRLSTATVQFNCQLNLGNANGSSAAADRGALYVSNDTETTLLAALNVAHRDATNSLIVSSQNYAGIITHAYDNTGAGAVLLLRRLFAGNVLELQNTSGTACLTSADTGATSIIGTAVVPLTVRRSNAGSVIVGRNTGNTADTFTVSDAGALRVASTIGISAAVLGTNETILTASASGLQFSGQGNGAIYAGATGANLGVASRGWNVYVTNITQSVSGSTTNPIKILTQTAAGANIGLDFSHTSSPNTAAVFYSGNTSGVMLQIPGAAPASVAGNGTAAINGVWNGATGGASSGVTGQTGGTGSSMSRTSGAGGAVAGASGIGGAAGDITDTCGNGGNGAATGGRGGNWSAVAGNAGTGGAAAAGTLTMQMGAATGAGALSSFSLTNAVPTTVLGIGYTGLLTTYGTVATAGRGVGAIYAAGSAFLQTGAVTGLASYTNGPTDGLFRVCVFLNMISWTTPATFNVEVVYTDDDGTARTQIVPLTQVAGTFAAAVTATGIWQGSVVLCANASTAININTSGTFTGSPSYNVYATIEQLKNE